MSKVIVYNEDSKLRILIPAKDITILSEAIMLGEKDVPTGLPFKVLERTDIPTDRTYRDYWEISDSELTDGVGQ